MKLIRMELKSEKKGGKSFMELEINLHAATRPKPSIHINKIQMACPSLWGL